MRTRFVPAALAVVAALAPPVAPTTPASAATAPRVRRPRADRRIQKSVLLALVLVVATAGMDAPASATPAPPGPAPAVVTVRPQPTPPPRPEPTPPAPFVDHYVQRIVTSDPVVFVTIDDGTYKDAAFLSRVRRTHLPVTVFLTNAAASGTGVSYFRSLQAAGAAIEDHTLRHPVLTRLPERVRREEICGAADRDRRAFGRRAQLLRPPYGAWDAAVLATARACGLHAVVGWDAVMPEHGGLQTWGGGGRLHPGDIVLLHFLPGLDGQIARLLATIRAQHLRVALLEDYL